VNPEEKPMPEDRKKEQRRRSRKNRGNPEFDMRTEASGFSVWI